MKISLKLISLLSPVLQDKGIAALIKAHTAETPEEVAEGSAVFYAALTESGKATAAEYLKEVVLGTKSIFAEKSAKGDSSAMFGRVDTELKILKLFIEQNNVLLNKLPEASREFFPVWESGEFNVTAKELAAEYAAHGYGEVRKGNALIFDTATCQIRPITTPSTQKLSDLKGYEEEKEAAVNNTLAFIEGKPASNVLFYGDRGTGKSSTVHALLNEFAPRGLRLLQLDKSAIPLFPVIKQRLSEFPRLKFIVFLDDLTFEEDESSYAALKAALEGSMVTADNVRIYVTTNRRHLIKESRSSREGDDVHAADSREETLSLFDRFGLVITYIAPSKTEYLDILMQIIADRNINVSKEDAFLAAEQYALRKGGRTPRAAKQVADLLSLKRK